MELTIHREGNSDLISDDVETKSFKKGSLPFAFFFFFFLVCVCVRERVLDLGEKQMSHLC